MFERFNEAARQVIVLAQEEARALGHNYVGGEHVLLGLLHPEAGVARQALEGLGISIEPVRGRVARIIGQGDGTPGQIPFTPRSKRVLELALQEAVSLGSNYVGSEHLLLALAREHEGVAFGILRDLGTDSERVRDDVFRLLETTPPANYEQRMARAQARARLHDGAVPWPLVLAAVVVALVLGIGVLIGWAIWG